MTIWYIKVRTRLRGQLLQAVYRQDEEVHRQQRDQNRVKGPKRKKNVLTQNTHFLNFILWNSPVYDSAE